MTHNYTEEPELESEESTSSRAVLSNGSIAELGEQAAEAYDGTKAAIRKACQRTSKAVQSGYKRTVDYGTQHPERFGLAAFAAGIGAGTLFAATALASRSSKTEKLATPLINAAADVARAMLRR
jgi:hypothetical protein